MQYFLNNGSWCIYFTVWIVFFTCWLSLKIVPLGSYFLQFYNEKNKAQAGWQTWTRSWTKVLWLYTLCSSHWSTSWSDFLSWCTFQLKSLFCRYRITSLTLLCHSLLNTSGSPWIPVDQRTKTTTKKKHLRYLTPCKCQNFIALDTNHFRASRPKINSCNVFCRKGYDISYKTE